MMIILFRVHHMRLGSSKLTACVWKTSSAWVAVPVTSRNSTSALNSESPRRPSTSAVTRNVPTWYLTLVHSGHFSCMNAHCAMLSARKYLASKCASDSPPLPRPVQIPDVLPPGEVCAKCHALMSPRLAKTGLLQSLLIQTTPISFLFKSLSLMYTDFPVLVRKAIVFMFSVSVVAVLSRVLCFYAVSNYYGFKLCNP